LGRIPEEWDVVRFGDVCDMVLGKMLDKEKNKGTYQPYLRNINVRWGIFDFTDLVEMPFQENESERYGLKKNDLIICEGGEPGRCAVWNNDFSNMKFQKALHRVRCKRDIKVHFLYNEMFWFGENKKLEDYFSGTTIKHLTGEALKTIPIFKPTIKEQLQIVDKLNQFDTFISDYRERLTKLHLQKSGLMHDLLTGKVRVNNCEEQQEKTSTVDLTQHKTQARNQYFEDAVLISAIVNDFYSEKYFLGRKKVQKLLYLLRRHQEASVAGFKKKAAGPYADEVRYKGGEPIAKQQKYINAKTNNAGTIFSKGENITQALGYIEKWEMQASIEWLSNRFKYVKVDQLELIATVDMARCDLEKEGIPVSLSTIKNLIATSKEWKTKLEKTFFDDLSIQQGIDESYRLFSKNDRI
jgi:type I restriction enzyme S subunit